MRMRPVRALYRLLGISMLTLLLFFSCRKMDLSNSEPEAHIQLPPQDRFFEEHRTNDPLENTIVSYLKRKNDSLKFVEKTITKIGFPQWDKMISLSRKNSEGSRITHDTTGITYYIPFARDTQNFVNASLAIRMGPSDTSFTYLYDWQYHTLRNSATSVNDPAEQWAVFFMKLTQHVFNYTQYEILDPSLFSKNGKQAAYVRLDSAASVAQRYQLVQYCQPVTVSFVDCPYVGLGYAECTPSCDRCPQFCLNALSYTYCWEEWEDDEGGGGTGGGGIGGDPPVGGGGSGGGGGNPGGSLGWIPDEPGADEPLLEKPYAEAALFNGISTYITSSGVPFTLPANATLKVYENIDLDVFPNGALYGFTLPNNKKYVAIQKSFMATGAIMVPKPEFTQFYEVINNVVQWHSPLNPSIAGITYPQPDANGVIKIVRIKTIKNAAGSCQVVREVVDYTPSPNAASSMDISHAVNYDVEYVSAAPGTTAEAINTNCYGSSTGNPAYIRTLSAYVNQFGPDLHAFLRDRLHSSVKIYLYDCATQKVKTTITGAGVASVISSQQTPQMDTFNNGVFKATDADIAIGACLQSNGQWSYQAKLNYTKLGTVHPKIAPYLNEVLTAIRQQVDAEVGQLRTAGRATVAEEYTVENGEKFFKASMGLLEAVATFWDIGKHIVKEARIPEWVWNQGNLAGSINYIIKAEYDKSAIHLPSVVAGATDQIIDETTGVVQLAETSIQFMRHPGKSFRTLWEGLRNLNIDKIRQMLVSISGIDNYTAGGDRARYQGGRHTVQMAMIVLGPVKVMTKGKDVVKAGGEGVTDLQRYVPDGSSNHPAANAINNARENNKLIKDIDNEKLLTKNVVNGEETFVSIEKKGATSEVFEAKKTDFLDENGNQLTDNAIQEALEEGAKDVILPLNPNNSYKRGQKGGWNKELNKHPLTPSTIYDVDGFKYHTNATGQVTKVEISNLQKSTPPWDRNRYQQSLKANKAKDGLAGQDQGGHLLAAQFGGPGEQINLVPMRKTLNQHPGTWAQMEQEWANTLNGSGTVTNIEINITYGSNGRPVGFVVRGKVNGTPDTWNHIN